MNREAMKQQIQEALSKKLGDGFRITIQKVFKPNRELDGLLIMGEEEIIGPTIYLEPVYEALDNGTPVEQVVDRIEIGKYGYLLSTCDGMASVVEESYKVTWFLTREEAEAALKGLEGGK